MKAEKKLFLNGLTVAELKLIINDWPETDNNGNPCEVWIETGKDLSSPVVEVSPLNYRTTEEGDMVFADLMLLAGNWR